VRQLPLFASLVPGVTMHTTGLAEPIGSLYEGERLAEALRQTRARTLAIYGHLDLGALEVECLPIVNPPLWELAHVAWFQEFWCLRGGLASSGSILEGADALFDSSAVPHDSRWTLAYPSMQALASYMNDTLDATLENLSAAPEEGRYFFNKFEPPESNYKAIERYRQAIERDPGFAPAYAGLADAYAYLAENFVTAPREVMPKAREAAEKAVALDDSSAEAHTSLGIVKLDYDRDRDGAQREFVRAIQLNPGSGYAHHWYAHSLEAQGRLEPAMKEMRAALDLDPLSLPINWDIGSELLGAGRYDEALQHLQKATELFPNNPVLAFLELEAYFHKGDRERARRVVESLRASQPEMAKDPMFLSMTGIQAALEGRRGETRQILDRFERLRQTQYVDPFMAIPLCSALNDKKQLLLWLKRADEERSTMFVYLPMMKDLYGLDPATVAHLETAR